MKVRSDFNKVSELVAADNVRCAAEDLLERRALLTQLKAYRHSILAAGSVDLSKLDDWVINLSPNSSLGRLHAFACTMFIDLVGVGSPARLSLSGNVEGYEHEHGWVNQMHHVQYFPGASEKLIRLVEMAKKTGGLIHNYGSAQLSQWLRFHGLKAPTNLQQLESLIAFFHWEDRPHKVENYWEQVTGHDVESPTLTASQCDEIRALTAQFVPAGKSLLDMLYENVKPVLSDPVSWENADSVILKLVQHPDSIALAQKYITGLGWWGARAGEQVDVKDYSQILYTAILVQLDPLIGGDSKRNLIANYDIYAPSVAADKSLETIRQGFDQHLVAGKKISRILAPLASHMLLSSAAPCFLVKDVPAWLTVGSIGWVTFCQAVSMIEFNNQGASRTLKYADVMHFADMDSISEDLGKLQQLAAMGVIVDWGLINEIISLEQLKQSAADAVKVALDAYKVHVDTIVNGAQAFATIVPSRRKIALEALERALPECGFLQQPLLRPEPFSSMRVSMLDLHIEGELTSGKWDWNKTPHILEAYPALNGLTPVADAFTAGVRTYHENLHKAIASNVKLALSGMPLEDRNIFAKSEITFFTCRTSVTEDYLQPVKIFPHPLYEDAVGVEQWIKKDKATGRFAVIMVASYGDNQTLCYEMFSLLGECRRNDQLGQLIRDENRMKMAARLDYKGGLNEFTLPMRTSKAPTDLTSYTQGNRPRPSAMDVMIIEKLGVLAAPTSALDKKISLYQFFMNSHIENIAQFIVKHRSVGSVSEFVEAFADYTEKEQKQRTHDAVVTFIVDMVVPFKRCIEDLASGERNKIIDGVYGCTMDAIGIFFTILGAPAKALSIAAKTASHVSRLAKAMKYGLKLIVSTLNPIDGLPTATYRIGKILLKSGVKLLPEGVKIFGVASSQLLRLTSGSESLLLLKLASVSQLGHGVFRPRGSTSAVKNVCAISRGNQWYAISRRGTPWGQQLAGFELSRTFSVPSFRPETYTRYIIEQSLLKMRGKVSAAIALLKAPQHKLKTDLAVGLFLGSTPNGRQIVSDILTAIRLNIDDISVSNFFLDPLKVGEETIEIDLGRYKEWKENRLEHKAVEWLTINNQNLNARFETAGFNYGEVADDLLHEMFRAESGKIDLVSAKAAVLNSKPALNVTPLLNLAAGRLPKTDGTGGFHSPVDASLNADSLALLVALLNHLGWHPNEYEQTFATLDAAVKGSAGRTIENEVLVSLNIN